MNATPVIGVQGVHKSYHIGEVLTPVLCGVDLEIHRGDFVVIFGVSGSGKTTLLNLMGAIDTVDEGSIRIDGLELAGAAREQLIDARRVKIGYIFQFYNLIPTLTAIENVEMALELLGLDRAEIKGRSNHYLERVGMLALAHKYPDQLSGGEQQRVAIARALAKEPAVVLADEPTGNLDEHTAAGVVRLMQELNRTTGITFVIASHNKELAKVATRVFHITDGRLAH
ncbi:MAG TPA: ABC transporter ATP-binding protein [Deltaproteobacteria bacterium]|nr:ABC transporter ATP-binding protein [Deltaproteobacteria bacterium]